MPRTLCVLAALLAGGGCTVGPDFKPPSWSSPSTWFGGHPTPARAEFSITVPEPIDPEWWRLFNDPELTSLERRVAAENLDVRAATIRLAESRAQLGITRASEFPTLNGNASYARQKVSNKGVFTAPATAGTSTFSANGAFGNNPIAPSTRGNIPAFDIYQYGFDASWEVDLWGRVARSVESARASVTSTEEDRRNVLLSNLAELARDYLELRGTQEQIRIARENVRSAQESLRLTQERATGGMTTDLDVANATAQVRTFAAQIPTLEQQESSLINAISLLLGQPPNALRAEMVDVGPIPPVPPRVPVGFPSELARRRPDIRQAEAQLHAATANIGVAIANFYPALTLNGSFGFQAIQPWQVFDLNARQYSAGPGLTVPIFQGGQLRYTLPLREQQQQEAAVNYQKTVLSAWHDVDNALTAYRTEQVRRNELIGAVQQNRRALSIAQSRYREGVTDFLQVLDVQRNLLSTEQQLAQSTTNVSANLVALYKALGGGWEPNFPLESDAASASQQVVAEGSSP